jgi:CRP/FNR family cyclic AMP-dependent transcriptional regulator
VCLTSRVDWPVLASLSESDRRVLLGAARPRRFARNETLVHEGDPADSLHLIAEGRLAVRSSLPSGDSVTLGILVPGTYFGELSLLRDDRRRTASVVALEPAQTLAVAAPVFHRLCASHPQVERALTVLLADRVDELGGRLLEAMYVGLDRRVIRRLLELSAIYGTQQAGPVTIPLTQADLANLVGGTRPTVNQVLQQLAEAGVVGLRRGRIDVLDVRALTRRAGH